MSSFHHIAQRGWGIALHGGAGAIERQGMDPKLEAAYRSSLAEALQAGAGILDGNGSALDAVEKAITFLEDDPLFNAGRGAVFTASGENELDASIMDGATLRAGAVAGVTRTRHPISLARSHHGKISPRHADRRWRGCFRQGARARTGGSKFLFYGAAMGGTCSPAYEGGPAHTCSRDPRTRDRRCGGIGSRWERGRRNLDGRGASETSRTRRRLQASLAQAPMHPMPPALSRGRALGEFLSVSPWRMKSARLCSTKTCRFRQRPTKSSIPA